LALDAQAGSSGRGGRRGRRCPAPRSVAFPRRLAYRRWSREASTSACGSSSKPPTQSTSAHPSKQRSCGRQPSTRTSRGSKW